MQTECKKAGRTDFTGFPQDPMRQLSASIGAVFNSWNSKRAVAYRTKLNIPHTYGTACSLQTMVFGTLCCFPFAFVACECVCSDFLLGVTCLLCPRSVALC